MINQAISGIARGFSATAVYSIEHDGKNVQLGALLFGYLQVGMAYSLVSRALSIAKVTPVMPSAVGWICLIAPAAVSLIRHQLIGEDNKSTLGHAFKLLEGHIGTVCQVAMLASSIAIAVFGSPVFGVLSALFIAYGLARENGLLDKTVIEKPLLWTGLGCMEFRLLASGFIPYQVAAVGIAALAVLAMLKQD